MVMIADEPTRLVRHGGDAELVLPVQLGEVACDDVLCLEVSMDPVTLNSTGGLPRFTVGRRRRRGLASRQEQRDKERMHDHSHGADANTTRGRSDRRDLS